MVQSPRIVTLEDFVFEITREQKPQVRQLKEREKEEIAKCQL